MGKDIEFAANQISVRERKGQCRPQPILRVPVESFGVGLVSIIGAHQ